MGALRLAHLRTRKARAVCFGDSVAVGAWYQEKLGLRLTPYKSEEFSALLSFDQKDQTGLALISPDDTGAKVEKHPILFTKKIERAHEAFVARGISVGPIDSDSR
jgi:hypothetical protein